MKTWTRPNGRYPKYFHTTAVCIAQLVGDKHNGAKAPAGVALCPDCEHMMLEMA